MLSAALVKIHSGNYDTTTVYNLDISDLDLTDISQLSKLCPDLISLDVSGNKLKSLAGVSGLTKLEKLILDGTSVPLTGIGKLSNLQSLSLKNCGISQLSSLIPEEFKKLTNLKYLDLSDNPIAQLPTLPQYVREAMPTVRQLNGEFLLFPKFDNSSIQKPPTVSFAGPDVNINFDDVEQKLKKQMDEVSSSIKECQQRISEAETLIQQRLKDVREYAESIILDDDDTKDNV
ncbi:leucine-rich repeat domain-containing protein [Histomonas meleagridis]|uniref:leucine-rich repeat domain-containing protein n=1 Tax=Histomonas meleagridis TaxID=135588 RepID=UPI00355A7B47|nr:leucine-rich repeat domain-containing protein [Histomonas meleagridis]KAH0804422.1 leucine-rich repeat domain-containing protein [Histomonas meleagridis]